MFIFEIMVIMCGEIINTFMPERTNNSNMK